MAMAAQRPRTIKKIEKPKPLKIQRTMPMMDTRLTAAVSPFAFNDIVSLVDSVAMMLENGYSKGMYDQNIQATIVTMCNHLKLYSHDLEKMFKDQLDRAFIAIRNASVDTRLDTTTRVHLLELIELRAKQWHNNDNMNAYYSQKLSNLDIPETTVLISSPLTTPIATTSPPLLGPGEVLKSSGKFAKPTRIPGKNYCKDEVVIRNSDSGKVMGIKGRRVHMIEELSETTISFQRVNPGAKERLVQITGTSEEKIYYAKDLIKDTIHRNASPIRRGSSTSINSSESDDSNQIQTVSSVHSVLSRSYSTNDANNIEEFKYTHTVKVGHDSVTITGTNIDLVEAAKVALDNYFSEGYDHRGDYFNYDEENAYTPLTPTSTMSVSAGQTTLQSLDINSNDGSILLNNDQPLVETEVDSKKKDKNVRELSYEFLMQCAKGPYAKQPPTDWDKIVQDFPNIIRKSPICWFEPEAHKAKVAAGDFWIISAGDRENETE